MMDLLGPKFRLIMFGRAMFGMVWAGFPLLGVLISTATFWNMAWWIAFALWQFILLRPHPNKRGPEDNELIVSAAIASGILVVLLETKGRIPEVGVYIGITALLAAIYNAYRVATVINLKFALEQISDEDETEKPGVKS